ncbi:MAG: DNA polymerase III subunit gamma/tau [Patescibacteria group bacterium]
MTTLYRKYRPREFQDIMGQDHVTKTLAAAVEKQRIAHAYLFYGARGTGKTTTARVLAQNLGASGLNVIEIDAASNRGIDDIRSLRENVALSPTEGKYKVYIIDEVHMLTKEAFSALLKTLEEPVKHVVFILATTELHKVPATIISRCQVYRFRRATDEEMRQRLSWILQQEKREVADDAIDFLVARSDGCYRDAESLLGQVLTWKEGKITAEDLASFLGLPERELLEQFLAALVGGSAQAALSTIDAVYNEGVDPDQFLHESIRAARDEALRLATLAQGKAADMQKLSRLPVIIRALLQAVQDLAYVPEPRVALQLAALSVTTSSEIVPRGSQAAPPPAKALAPALIKSKKAPEQPGNVSAVKKVWAKLITNVKSANPVASTFLRATDPTAWGEGIITVRVQYPLHRNFFERPENKKIVEEELSKLLDTPVTVRFQLEEPTITSGVAVQQVQKQEEDLFEAAKQVFAKK